MIDFTKLTGIEHDGKAVVQIEDSAGRVLWAVQSDEPVVLQVEKQSITSYAGETSYSDNCVLLDIYPKRSNSEIKVTYGGLTKTLTFSGFNAMQVYFGTFNGVSDSVATPASGTLTIEGACDGFACGVYQSGSKDTNKGYCSCITAVDEFGGIGQIYSYAFYYCDKLVLTELPSGIRSIGNYAFYGCTGLASITIPDGVKTINGLAFGGCSGLTSVIIPASVSTISTGSSYAFDSCVKLASFVVDEGNETYSAEDCVLFDKNKTKILAGSYLPGTYTIPASVTTIGAGAYYERKAETTVIVHKDITDIGTNAFYLSGGNGAYTMTVVMLSTTPPTIGTSAFKNDSKYSKIIVPAGCEAVYKAASGWSSYEAIITEAS